MEQGIYNIAGFVVQICSQHQAVQRMCADYAAVGTPEVTISTSQADIGFERQKSQRERETEGLAPHDFPDDYLETLAVYRKLVQALLPHQVLLFHGAAVAVQGETYLFTARSGTGKSTHVRLWLQEIPGSFVVNGDKPLLKFTDRGILVCGTPWQGKENWGRNIELPLKAVCILERDKRNHIAPISAREAFPTLLSQAYRPDAMEGMRQTMELVGRLGQQTKLYRLGCNMEPEAARVSYEGMK